MVNIVSLQRIWGWGKPAGNVKKGSGDHPKTGLDFKTSPHVYQLAVDKMGVERGEIAFISSNFWDAAGAKAIGLGFTPDATVSSLSDLAKVLPR